MRKKSFISVIIPVHNEEKSIPELYQNLKEVLKNLHYGYEIIFVDDGSTDTTFGILSSLFSKNKDLKVIQLKRNIGKSAALSAGFGHANGDVIITMDGDLQDSSREIPRLIEKIEEGYDMVVGWKFPRNDPLAKIIPSKIFNLLTSLVSGLKLHDFNCGLKAMKKDVAESLSLYGELHRYLPVLAFWEGYNVCEIKVEHHPRKYGQSKYGATRIMRGFLDLLTIKFLRSYSARPLHLFGSVGLLLFFVGTIINMYLTYEWIVGKGIGNRPLLFLGILMMVLGVQFLAIGLLGELIANFTNTSKVTYKIGRILEK